MKFIHRISLLLALAAGPTLVITSCFSDKKEDPAPTTGSLTGTISPADAVSSVTATDAGGLTFLATPNATTGAFAFEALKPGAYTLAFTPASGYLPPADRSISIEAGKAAAAGTVQVSSDGSIRSGSLSWTLNGTTYTTTNVTGGLSTPSMSSSIFSLSATAASGATAENIRFAISGFALVPAQYLLGASVYTTAAYQRTNGGIITATYGGIGVSNQATGTFTNDSYDATTRTLRGTFGFTASSTSGGGPISVTNGTFTLKF